jgi:hypothetical protein
VGGMSWNADAAIVRARRDLAARPAPRFRRGRITDRIPLIFRNIGRAPRSLRSAKGKMGGRRGCKLALTRLRPSSSEPGVQLSFCTGLSINLIA